jgi:16S rRNA (uracil1498-N3)-methyltransferase
MSVPYVFVDAADCSGGRVALRGPVAHHVLTVLRRGRGDAVSVADGSGAVRRCRIDRVRDGEAACAVTATADVPLPAPAVRAVCGLPRQRKLDDVVQRLTELGVDEIVPVHTARSQVRLEGTRADRAVARWRAVARAAAEQSRRSRLPVVAPVTAWTDAFTGVTDGVVLWEDAKTALATVAFDGAARVSIGVGPEGGLTAAEVDAAGVPAAGLGSTILRTETAAVVGPALVLHRVGRLG